MHTQTILLLFTCLLSTYVTATPTSEPPQIQTSTCSNPLYPASNPNLSCTLILMAHTGIVDIDIYDTRCNRVGFSRFQSYSKKTKVGTSFPLLTDKNGKGKKGSSDVEVTPQGMQGTLQPKVKYRGKTFGDDTTRGHHDQDSGSWSSVVEFQC